MWILIGIFWTVLAYLFFQALDGFRSDIADKNRQDEEKHKIDSVRKDVDEYNRLYPNGPHKVDPKVFK